MRTGRWAGEENGQVGLSRSSEEGCFRPSSACVDVEALHAAEYQKALWAEGQKLEAATSVETMTGSCLTRAGRGKGGRLVNYAASIDVPSGATLPASLREPLFLPAHGVQQKNVLRLVRLVVNILRYFARLA